jgi:hypothetical protein
MKIDDTLAELEGVAEKKQIRVSYEALTGEVGTGGLCKVKGQLRIILDKRSSPGEKATALAQALSRVPLDDVFISEETRRLIEGFVPNTQDRSTAPAGS